MESIASGITEGLLLLSDSCKILWANDAFLKQSNSDLKKISGKYCHQVLGNFDENSTSLHSCPVCLLKKTGKASTLIYSHDGREVKVSAYPVTDDKGDIIQFVQVSKDILQSENRGHLLKKSNDELELWAEQLEREIDERKIVEKKLLENRKRLRYLAVELSLTEERERRTIASELHDRIGQSLAIAKIKLKTLQAESKSEELDEIIGIVEQTIHDTRILSFEISPPMLHKFGLESTLEWLFEQIQEQHGLIVRIDKQRFPKIDGDIEIILFQTVRELLMNVVKHAQARTVNVSIKNEGNYLRILVTDDGKGFDVSQIDVDTSDSFGLFNICERLDHIGGNIEITSKINQGTRISLSAPIMKCQ